MDSCSTAFQARLFLDDEALYRVDVWVDEIEPTDDLGGRRPLSEWVAEHIRELGVVELIQALSLFEHDMTQARQVVTRGRLDGWFSGADPEWDERIEFDEVRSAPVPEKWLRDNLLQPEAKP